MPRMRPPPTSACSAALTLSGVRPRSFHRSMMQHHAGWPFLAVEAFGLDDLLDQTQLVVGVDDGEVGLEPRGLSVLAQDARRQRMECAEPPAFDRPPDELADPCLHLA